MTVPMPIQENIKQMNRAGISERKIAEQLGIARNTVSKYVNQEDFSLKPEIVTTNSMVDEYAHIIEKWLKEDLKQPKKQRHTVTRIHARLAAEHGFGGSYRVVARWMQTRKALNAQAGEGYSELSWAPGCTQADFGEADIMLRGTTVRTHFLVVTYPFSNARYSVALPGETSECVAEGLKTIFVHTGFVPHIIIFDNATGVGRKNRDKEIVEAKVFQAFRLHYGFKARFTNPYAGHEKGSVENAVGFLRRNLLVPVPHVESLAGLTKFLLAQCDQLLTQVHYRKGQSIASLFDADRQAGGSLPGISFDACTWEKRSVDLVGNITLNGVKYYVGSHLGGMRVHVGVRAFTVEILDMTGVHVIEHTRIYGRQSETVRFQAQLLPSLIRKPSSVRNSPMRENLPGVTLQYLDAAGHEQRRRLFEILDATTRICGFENATEIIDQVLAGGRELKLQEVLMAARRINENETVNSLNLNDETGIDLGIYDLLIGAK